MARLTQRLTYPLTQSPATAPSAFADFGGVNLPLPTLPLANGALVSMHGNSLVAFNNFTGAVHTLNGDLGAVNMCTGPMEVALGLDPRFNFDTWYDPADPWSRFGQGANQGIAGDHLDWDGTANGIAGGGILPRLDYTLAHNALAVWLEGSTNSLATGDVSGSSTGASAAYVIAKLDAGLRKIRRRGKWAVIETVRPRTDFDAGKEANRQAVNTWIRAQAGRDGVFAIVDLDPLLFPGGVQDISLYLLEAGNYVHPNQKGAFLIGRDYYLPILQALISAGTVFNTSPTVSNLIGSTFAQLQGNNGVKAGGTGAVAAGWYLKRRRGTGSSSTYIGTMESIVGTTYQKQVLTITPVNDGNLVHQFDFGSPYITTGLPAADSWVRAYCQVEVGNTEAIPLTILNLVVNDSATGSGQGTLLDDGLGTDRCRARAGYGSFAATAFGHLPAVANRSMWLITKPLYIPAGVSFNRLGIIVQIYLDERTTDTNIVVKVRDPIIRSIPDPRPAWGY